MSKSLGTLLFAGMLAMASQPAFAEPVSLSDALARGQDVSPRIAKAKAELKAAEGRAMLDFREAGQNAVRDRLVLASTVAETIARPSWLGNGISVAFEADPQRSASA